MVIQLFKYMQEKPVRDKNISIIFIFLSLLEIGGKS